MTKLSQLKQRQASHVIIFGDPKTGKSTLASELVKAGYKLLWISVDNGHDVLYKLSPEEQEAIDILVLPDTKDFPVAIDTCLKLVSGARLNICTLHGQVGCISCKKNNPEGFEEHCLSALDLKTVVVFDHASQIATSAMNFILKGKEDTFKPEWEHYRIQGTLMDKFLTNIQQSTYNVICIAHVAETKMEDGTKKLVPQVGSDAFSRNAGKYFDHMVYCEIMNKSHRFGSGTTYKASVVTGSRRDIAIEDNPEAPSLARFFTVGHNAAAVQAVAVEVKEHLAKAVEQVTTVRQAEAAAPTTEVTTTLPANLSAADKLKLLRARK